MKSSSYTLIGILFMAITSCTGQNNTESSYGESDPYNQSNTNYSNQVQPDAYNAGTNGANQQSFSQNQGGDKILMHAIMNPKINQPSSHIPLPASWKFGNGSQPNSPAITGPNGVEIYYYPYQSFVYTNDPYTQQAYQSAGMNLRQPAGIEIVLNQDIAQMAKSNGLKFIKHYPLPQIAQKDKSYMDQLYAAGPRQTNFLAAGSEYENTNGNKVLIVTHYSEMMSSGMINWGYYIQALESKPAAFEKAKNAFINGLANIQYNRQEIDAYNRAEAAKANQSWTTHNQKMQNNQAAFDARQRTHQSTVDAWNKSSMDAYNSRSASQDRMQDQTINSIYERENVTDPNNGQQYKVEGYSNQYWMNGQGEYIPSDNSLYNPNLDPEYNNQNWEEAPVSPY